MGLFDSLVGAVEGQMTQRAALAPEAGNVINEAGGVGGLLQQAEQKGLGGLVSGWVGPRAATAISSDQIINLIGQERVAAIAGRAGLSEAQVAMGLAFILPMIVSHLTPNGTVPEHSPAAVDSAVSAVATAPSTTPPPPVAPADDAPATS